MQQAVGISQENKNVIATIECHPNIYELKLRKQKQNTILCNENWQIEKMHNKDAQMSQDCPYMKDSAMDHRENHTKYNP